MDKLRYPMAGVDAQAPWPAPGMTLRDYFAAKSLPEAFRYVRDLTAEEPGETFDWFGTEEPATVDMEMVATRAYSMADAMLKARAE